METKMNKVFLVPTDFSEVCANATKMAANAARYLNYKVSLLHVIDKTTKAELKKEGKGESYIKEKLEEIAKQTAKEFGIEVDYHAKEGSIFITIAETAKKIGASLIYLGTHGKVGMQKLTGSYALKVITSSEVPVIVTQKRYFKDAYTDIVLPITSDAGPWEKTKWAAFIAKQFDAKIHIYQLDNDEIDDAVELITNHFKANDVAFEIKRADKSSNFTKQVIDYATAIDAGLIMIMTNPEMGFTKFILGSYDEEMIFNTSQIPVMCVNPRDFNWRKIVSR
ncbi:MAG: universal stress protein [Bacteroidales bacterium]|nr:universal stress protein [Bacteroidales bacterium]MCF8344537.1 universal stress protein [Bacteroidales bacterium]MCF8352523.1 universal stress protein [Bacteroidales bacterium]MCF8377810.1 universal stress protein [Bacteroidales bacterium]